MSKKKATSSEVAEKAGVSQATVSMVLNKKYNVSFSRETVEKVEQAARELGYQLPSRKNKKDSKKEKLIVVFCPTLTSPYYVLLLQGVEAVANKQGYGVFICNTQRDARLEEKYLRMMHTIQPQGIIYSCNPNPDFQQQVEQLAQSMVNARSNIRYCKECFTLTDQELCPICSSAKRDKSVIMVVETSRDLAAYEKTGKFDGVYHVLHGAISPMLGIGPGDIKIKELLVRLQREDVREVIIATNSSLEGEATAMYISKLIKPAGIKVTRIASGVPVGGDLEYIDEVTLTRALDGRVEL